MRQANARIIATLGVVLTSLSGTNVMAQAADPAAPNPLFESVAPSFLSLSFSIFSSSALRPMRAKTHLEMVNNVRRGDVVVTGGGLVGKVSKVLDDTEVMVDLADGVSVKVVKATLSDVRTKPEPANDDKK